MAGKSRKTDTVMTSGPIVRHLLRFSLPVMMGYVFQQLYSTVDSLIVGRYVSMQALAAVGSTGNIIFVLLGAFMGFSMGAGVIISQHFGAREPERVGAAVHTALLLAALVGTAFIAVGWLFSPAMLRFMKTPDDVYPEALTYLRVYFAGSLSIVVYNVGAGILNAVGDSRRPFYFLVISAVTNTALDLLFVVRFGWGVAGVGWATVIAQTVALVCVLGALLLTKECYALRPRELRIERAMLQRIVRIGLPTSVQQVLTSFSNVFVQSYINSFQTACMAGWTAYTRIDGFTAIPIQTFSGAAMTFVGQNIGAGDLPRAKRGANTALALSMAAIALLQVPLQLFAPQVIELFGSGEQATDAVAYGVMFLRAVSPLNLLLCPAMVYAGAMRGVGDTRIPTLLQILGYIVTRQIYLALVAHFTDSALLVGLGYPVGWLACSVFMLLYYRCSGWEKRIMRITDAPVREETP